MNENKKSLINIILSACYLFLIVSFFLLFNSLDSAVLHYSNGFFEKSGVQVISSTGSYLISVGFPILIFMSYLFISSIREIKSPFFRSLPVVGKVIDFSEKIRFIKVSKVIYFSVSFFFILFSFFNINYSFFSIFIDSSLKSYLTPTFEFLPGLYGQIVFKYICLFTYSFLGLFFLFVKSRTSLSIEVKASLLFIMIIGFIASSSSFLSYMNNIEEASLNSDFIWAVLQMLSLKMLIICFIVFSCLFFTKNDYRYFTLKDGTKFSIRFFLKTTGFLTLFLLAFSFMVFAVQAKRVDSIKNSYYTVDIYGKYYTFDISIKTFPGNNPYVEEAVESYMGVNSHNIIPIEKSFYSKPFQDEFNVTTWENMSFLKTNTKILLSSLEKTRDNLSSMKNLEGKYLNVSDAIRFAMTSILYHSAPYEIVSPSLFAIQRGDFQLAVDSYLDNVVNNNYLRTPFPDGNDNSNTGIGSLSLLNMISFLVYNDYAHLDFNDIYDSNSREIIKSTIQSMQTQSKYSEDLKIEDVREIIDFFNY